LDITSNKIAREYPTVLRRALKDPANYAGHYTVAIWGCGSSCLMFAVIDRETGRVITPKGFSTVSGVHLAADDFLPDTPKNTWALRFKPESTLLVVLGALDEDEQNRNGAFYYTLKGDQLVLVHTTVVKKTCAAPRS
jgi:hypothetical protein